MKRSVILIAGPTASGKSAFAIKKALQLGGVIINADSQQLYEGLPLLTAQPSPEDYHTVPHVLYGAFAYDAPDITVETWQKAAYHHIEATFAQGKVPLVVGGTGFYLKVLMGGLSPIPPLSAQQKAPLLQRWQEWPTADLHQLLTQQDPLMARRLYAQDRQRIQRALLVYALTGRPLSSWHAVAPPPCPYHFIPWAVLPPREITRQRIHQRFVQMLESGVCEEVVAFAQRPGFTTSPLRQALGIEEILAYHQGTLSLEACIMRYVQKTAQYAKRQRTWFARPPYQPVSDLIS